MPMQTRRPMPHRDERDEQIDTRARSHALDFMTAATQVLTVMCLVKGNPAWKGGLSLLFFGCAAALVYKYEPYEEKPYLAVAAGLGAVGAALLAKDGRVYTGCNIECATYTPTNCAERTALFKAVSEGEREFTAIAIVGSKVGEKNTLVTGPCGVCRQALFEFGGPSLTVIMAKSEDDYIVMTLGELLPYGFGPANLD